MDKKALIIDDTRNIRLMLTKCLELEGYNVETADNGKDGLDMAATNAYDLIFLDIKLPEMSGTEVLRKLRGKDVLTPVIIITAYPTVKNAVDCTQMGAITYLQKPFTTERIHNVLYELSLDNTTTAAPLINYDLIALSIEKGDYEKALADLKTALSITPNESRIYNLFGRIYMLMGDTELSTKFYQTENIFK